MTAPQLPYRLTRRFSRLLWVLVVAVTAGAVSLRLLTGGAASSGIVWVPGLEHLFGDLRTYLAAADCTRLGVSPYDAASPCLYWSDSPYGGVPSNAPPYFHEALRAIGATQAWAGMTGWFFLAGFFTAAALMPVGRRPIGLSIQSAAFVILCMSPAGMLGFAKANVEVAFVALGIAAASLASRPGAIAAVGPWLLALPASVKYVPGVPLAVFLVPRNRWLRLSALAAIAVVGILFFATLDSLGRRLQLTPQGQANSFGASLDARVLFGNEIPRPAVLVIGAVVIGAGCVAGIAALLKTDSLKRLPLRPLMLAASGGLVVTFAWCVFTNWEYRWLWVVLAFPFLTSIGPKPFRQAGLAITLLASLAPWMTRTDIGLGVSTSILTVTAIFGLSAMVSVAIGALFAQRSAR